MTMDRISAGAEMRQVLPVMRSGPLSPLSSVSTVMYRPVRVPMAEEGSLSYLYNTEQELGTMPNILYSKGLTYHSGRNQHVDPSGLVLA